MGSRSFWSTGKENELLQIMLENRYPFLDLEHHCFVFLRSLVQVSTAATEAMAASWVSGSLH